jgi:hypothetical protein
MTIRISHDPGAPSASIELMISSHLLDYDLEEVEAPVPREVDPILASQGFKDLLDDVRALADREMAGSNLSITQLTGAICRDNAVHRPGIWLVVRELGPASAMSPGGMERVAALAEAIRSAFRLS